jgi:hypothetical protein
VVQHVTRAAPCRMFPSVALQLEAGS